MAKLKSVKGDFMAGALPLKQRRRRVERIRSIIAWGWMLRGDDGKWQLCYYAFPTKLTLLDDGKPSPEAKAVKVEIRLAKQAGRK